MSVSFLHQKVFSKKCIFRLLPHTIASSLYSFIFVVHFPKGLFTVYFSMQYPCSRYILTFYSMHYSRTIFHAMYIHPIPLFFFAIIAFREHFFIFLPLHNFFCLPPHMQLFFCGCSWTEHAICESSAQKVVCVHVCAEIKMK